jgi:hypothetical protein
MIKTYCCILVVRIAPGQVKHIMKSKDGRTEDWIKTVDSKGNMTWSGIEKKTGIKCHLILTTTVSKESFLELYSISLDILVRIRETYPKQL